jgi:uncharacterized damage-inducible protein DinB
MNRTNLPTFHADFAFSMHRQLDLLSNEIRSYPDDAGLWTTPAGIANSGGNLCLHLVGNLRHFIGHLLGGGDYVRDREQEFSANGLTRTELLGMIELCRQEFDTGLARLPEEQLTAIAPAKAAGTEVTVRQLLLHLLAHFAYHLGQINYHRRIGTTAHSD